MASSPAERATAPSRGPSAESASPAATPVAFALQELTACWNQGYEALVRGDLDRVQALVDIADDHVPNAGDGTSDSAAEAALRHEALAARGRLEHGMKAGLAGLQDELARARRGGQVLRGYANPLGGIGDSVTRDA